MGLFRSTIMINKARSQNYSRSKGNELFLTKWIVVYYLSSVPSVTHLRKVAIVSGDNLVPSFGINFLAP